jgi:hypothetical protein
MRCLDRLRREEDGQVLYMALVMMFFLVLFTLVLVNTIYMAGMKIKAQNAADNMALSAATLKARVLNKIVNINGILYIGVLWAGVVGDGKPYPTLLGFLEGLGVELGALSWVTGIIAKYENECDGQLGRIAQENGLDDSRHKFGVHPVDFDPLSFTYDYKWLYYTPPPPCTISLPFVVSINPVTPLAVGARVVFQTKNELIGGKFLQVLLPDIVTRACAEIYDAGTPIPGLPASCLHDWHVRLRQPDEQLDQYIKNNM